MAESPDFTHMCGAPLSLHLPRLGVRTSEATSGKGCRAELQGRGSRGRSLALGGPLAVSQSERPASIPALPPGPQFPCKMEITNPLQRGWVCGMQSVSCGCSQLSSGSGHPS